MRLVRAKETLGSLFLEETVVAPDGEPGQTPSGGQMDKQRPQLPPPFGISQAELRTG